MCTWLRRRARSDDDEFSLAVIRKSHKDFNGEQGKLKFIISVENSFPWSMNKRKIHFQDVYKVIEVTVIRALLLFSDTLSYNWATHFADITKNIAYQMISWLLASMYQ